MIGTVVGVEKKYGEEKTEMRVPPNASLSRKLHRAVYVYHRLVNPQKQRRSPPRGQLWQPFRATQPSQCRRSAPSPHLIGSHARARLRDRPPGPCFPVSRSLVRP